ncbi:hypothetical protein [Corynebacterium sp.]|uniref:hypothetical protein n=1 Tax=Corynebacterium sp. TaxID=1720 RepID=UPI0026DAAF9A|nr:hypothetical protein [Corynebacterium sp.]MDO5032704.1 hypothetical protein [Corynebacterium sp.]
MRIGAAFLSSSLALGALSACATDGKEALPGAVSATSAASATNTINAVRGGLAEDSGVEDSVGQILKAKKGQAMTYYRLHDGMHLGTVSEHDAGYALSLIKLYIATYVIEHGSFEDKYDALDMIASSSDVTAEKLFEKYPSSIDAIAREYGLEATKAGKTWGKSKTSTYDVVSFVVKLRQKDETHPVLVAMAHPDAISADGYAQDYGTAKLDDVVGSKWGWSDGKDRHSSVSFGKDFVVAASIEGSADELSAYVKKEITEKNLRRGTVRHEKALRGEPLETSRPAAPTSSAPSARKG